MLFLIKLFLLLTITSYNVQCHQHSAEPLMLLVSFDGFRWDYLLKHNLTNFNSLKLNGTYADRIYNSFATLTFPNHWTIATGLYEESHGIVHNIMYDNTLNETFHIDVFGAAENEWFAQNPQAVPIWIANQRAGESRQSAAEWVASDMKLNGDGVISIPYNRSTPFKDLVDQFISLFTREEKPINFGALYFDEPDHTGHLYGPNSTQMADKLQELDVILGYLIQELKSHHLFDKLNLIVTSDHGMEQVSNDTAIFLDKYIDVSLFRAYGSGALYNIFVDDMTKFDYVYETLRKIDNLVVYKKADIPDELHYKQNVRTGDIVIVAKLGYILFEWTHEVNWTTTNGNHGYFNNHTSMNPIFIAHGPAFKERHKVESFYNVDIYPLMCFVLKIAPGICGANNGTIENVIDLLKVDFFEREGNLYFILLIIVPIVLLGFTMICVLCISKNRMNKSLTLSNTGYKTLETDETAVEMQ